MMDVYKEFLDGEVGYHTLLNEISFSPDEFSDEVVEIILNSSFDIPPELEATLVARDFDVEIENDDSILAAVKRRSSTDIISLLVNISSFESLSQKEFQFTAAHEAAHIISPKGTGHKVDFFRRLQQLIEDNFNFDDFQELFERDILISGDRRSNLDIVLPKDPIFMPREEQMGVLERYLDAFDPIREITSILDLLSLAELDENIGRLLEWEGWNGRVGLQRKVPENMGGDIDANIRLSRGRGKQRLAVISLDLKTREWEVLEEDRWFIVDNFEVDRIDVNSVDLNLTLSTPSTSGSSIDGLRKLLRDIEGSLFELLDALRQV